MISVSSTMSVPPGGVWFWQDEGHSFSSPSFDVLVGLVGAALAESGDRRDPSQAILEYMAPRMPRGWATGYDGPRRPRMSDYLAAAVPYFSRPVDRVDRIVRRMSVCAACPKCSRPVCMACNGIPKRVSDAFGGLRPVLPSDGRSGVCQCAGTFTMVLASVTYGKEDPVWDGTPPECWRLNA